VNYDFCAGFCVKNMVFLELLYELSFVVDFTIECDPDGSIFVGEWLMWDRSVGYFERSVSQR